MMPTICKIASTVASMHRLAWHTVGDWCSIGFKRCVAFVWGPYDIGAVPKELSIVTLHWRARLQATPFKSMGLFRSSVPNNRYQRFSDY